ncbi:MAG: cupin domain-containing protein [Candidatus Gottesmanbacteria bacterium]|nr:cupin domain-containing protein [Candidatus Gottesmanbacteria bacterium]
MAEIEPAYSKSKYLLNNKYVTLAVYHLRPGGTEPKHFHNGVELMYILDGNCQTHEKGQLYRYEKGDVHEVINNSPNEIVFVRLSIPRDTPANKI